MFGVEELREICAEPSPSSRRLALRRAIVGKFAYFRTIGMLQRRPWTQVLLSQRALVELPVAAPPPPSSLDDPALAAKAVSSTAPPRHSEAAVPGEGPQPQSSADAAWPSTVHPAAGVQDDGPQSQGLADESSAAQPLRHAADDCSAELEASADETACAAVTAAATAAPLQAVCAAGTAAAEPPQRQRLRISGAEQRRWRVELHDVRGCCVAVCRAPPSEALDWTGEFRSTQAIRFPEIDLYDDALEHPEPGFLEVPIRQLLPEKWQSDYDRARGQGERGERTRMNYLGSKAPHIPNFKRTREVPQV